MRRLRRRVEGSLERAAPLIKAAPDNHGELAATAVAARCGIRRQVEPAMEYSQPPSR